MTTQEIVRDISRDVTRDISFMNGVSPVWSVDFTQGSMPGGLTFTRASGANCFNAAGALVSTASNAPRLDYDPVTLKARGLLMEEARTNYLLNSAAPATQTVSLAVGTYTLWLVGAGSCAAAAGTAVGTGFGTATSASAVVFTLTTAGTVVFTVSGSVTRFQCELGAFATSFITTTGTAATRAFETCLNASIPWFSATEGTLLVQAMTSQSVSTGYSAFISPNSVTNAIGQYITSADSRGIARVANSNVGNTVITPAPTPLVAFKQAFAYRQDDFALCRNGGTVVTDMVGSLPGVLTQLNIGSRLSVDSFNGWIMQISYYSTRLNNGLLAQITV